MISIYALHCGQLGIDRRSFFPDTASREEMIIPIPSYVIVHPKGNVLFDTGLHCDLAADPVARLGQSVAKFFRILSRPGEDVISQLALLGMRSDNISYIINSHFHFDHCGCNALFPRATFIAQQAEMQAARAAEGMYNAVDWDHGLDYKLVDGEYDVFGDGSIILLPTPGHTAGHQSLYVRTGPGMQFVLTADACYTKEHLDHGLLPTATTVWNKDAMTESLVTLRRMRDRRGVSLIYGHDVDQWLTIRHAPDEMD